MAPPFRLAPMHTHLLKFAFKPTNAKILDLPQAANALQDYSLPCIGVVYV